MLAKTWAHAKSKTGASKDTCCQHTLEIGLASVPSADAFAVLAQAVLKHLLYMRQQIPAPFDNLEEVQTPFSFSYSTSNSKQQLAMKSFCRARQGAACTSQQELGCQRCTLKQRLPAKDRKTARVRQYFCCFTILLSSFALTSCCVTYIDLFTGRCVLNKTCALRSSWRQPPASLPACAATPSCSKHMRACCCCSAPHRCDRSKYTTSCWTPRQNPCPEPRPMAAICRAAWCAACCVSSSAAQPTPLRAAHCAVNGALHWL